MSSKYQPTWLKYGETPWGYDADAEKPSKAEMFGESVDCLEDFLQHNEVFKNGMRDASCHMDSYMCVVDFVALNTCLDLLITEYAPTRDDWSLVIANWEENPNTQRPARIVARYLRLECMRDTSTL